MRKLVSRYTTSETGTLSSVPANEVSVRFPFKLRPRWSQFREVWVNFFPKITVKKLTLTSGPSQATARSKKLFCPKGPCLCWLLGLCSSPWLVGRGPQQQCTDPKPCQLQLRSPARKYFHIQTREVWHERANLNPGAHWSVTGSAPTYQTASS